MHRSIGTANVCNKIAFSHFKLACSFNLHTVNKKDKSSKPAFNLTLFNYWYENLVFPNVQVYF